jgi:AAA domain
MDAYTGAPAGAQDQFDEFSDLDFDDLDDELDPFHDNHGVPPIDDAPPLDEPPDGPSDGDEVEYGEGGAEQHDASSKSPLISSSAQFVRALTSPNYLLDGILQRRYCYALTAKTGAGKTALMLRISAHVALGRKIGHREVEHGKVLYFAGENPDDIRMRWIGLAQEMGFDPETVGVYFIPGTFPISAMRDRIRKEMQAIGNFSLIVVDTSAAFFEGEDENSNAQQGVHARRLRGLCKMPGGPCVLVACHPPKNAGDDNIQPRGGGAFLAEIDGNLTARKDDGAVAMHWQGKFRGPEFSEILFSLQTVTHPQLKDSRGRQIPTVVACPMGENAQEEMAAVSQEDHLLRALADAPQAS